MSARLTHNAGPRGDAPGITTDPRGFNGDPVATPELGRWSSEAFVAEHLGHLIDRRGVDLPDSSSEFRGGQRAADAALAAFDVTGYAVHKDQAYPLPRRSVSTLSPYVRHGLLDLQQLWDHVEGGPDDDVRAFRGALLWQEFARHRYARLRPGPRAGAVADPVSVGTAVGVAGRPTPFDRTATPVEITSKTTKTTTGAPSDASSLRSTTGRGWDRRMGCVEIAIDELEEDGWLVNQARRWLANHWTASGLEDPTEGEDYFFRHLIDGSRAANRLGWESPQQYAFTRWEVEERAAGLCATCDLVSACPIERPRHVEVDNSRMAADTLHPSWLGDDDVAGSTGPRMTIVGEDHGEGRGNDLDGTKHEGIGGPEAVWLTAESMGDADPALQAHPDLPAVFVFDEPLLAKLRLSSKRLTFLTETIADLASRRRVEVHVGDPVEILAGVPLATTFAPVPGWRARSARLTLASVHPWRWLREPHGGDATTFEAWRGGLA